MTIELFAKYFYIGLEIVKYLLITIGLIISLAATIHFIATKGWSDEVKPPKQWAREDAARAERWGEQWEKVTKARK